MRQATEAFETIQEESMRLGEQRREAAVKTELAETVKSASSCELSMTVTCTDSRHRCRHSSEHLAYDLL